MVDGEVRNAGVYSLSRPDFDIEQAVALAGGANQGVRRVRIVRTLKLDENASKEMSAGGTVPAAAIGTAAGKSSTTPNAASPSTPTVPAEPPPSVDDLLKQIQAPATAAPSPAPSPAPSTAPSDPSQPIEPIAPATKPAAPASPGALRSPSMVVDVDQLEAPKLEAPGVAEKSVPHADAAVQTPPTQQGATEARYVFDTQKQEWVFVPAGNSGPIGPDTNLAAPNSPDGALTGGAAATSDGRTLKQAVNFRLPNGRKTRVIIIDWEKLQKGDLTQNVLIRPGDKIHVESDIGVVYIDGEVARPGVYNLPPIGELTLSRLVTAAGGLGQIAIPQRVDLIRKVAPDREAALRVNLAAIRNKAEPDIVMRADDHVIIGTNFFATPLAVIRNGFRMTYGFGFLIDRNFGNDVFGPPPFTQQQF
jgi:protein involved in polysaccharide export with SLBB domain